jgi:hypothetical protein
LECGACLPQAGLAAALLFARVSVDFSANASFANWPPHPWTFAAQN